MKIAHYFSYMMILLSFTISQIYTSAPMDIPFSRVQSIVPVDDNTIIFSTADGKIVRYSLSQKKPEKEIVSNCYHGLRLHKDKSLLAGKTPSAIQEKASLTIFYAESLDTKNTLPLYRPSLKYGNFYCMEFGKQKHNQNILFLSSEKAVEKYDIMNHEIETINYDSTDNNRDIIVDPSKNIIYVATGRTIDNRKSAALAVYDLDLGTKEYQHISNQANPLACISNSDCAIIGLVDSNGHAFSINTSALSDIKQLSLFPSFCIKSFTFHPIQTNILALLCDGVLGYRLLSSWDSKINEKIANMVLPDDNNPESDDNNNPEAWSENIAFLPDGDRMVVALSNKLTVMNVPKAFMQKIIEK